MALKRELGMRDWETLIREVRARVETVETSSGAALYSCVGKVTGRDSAHKQILPARLPAYAYPRLACV